MGEERRPGDDLPAPPLVAARISLTAKQWIGLPFIALVPLLAVLGVFGERQDVVGARSSAVDVTISYPSRFRYRQVQPLRVTVRNRTSTPLDSIVVSFDTAYISRFAAVAFSPAVVAAYDVWIPRLAPGAAALVGLEMSGDKYGRHRGRVIVRVNGDRLSVPLSTFVFP